MSKEKETKQEELTQNYEYLEMFFNQLAYKQIYLQARSNKEFCYEYEHVCKDNNGEFDYRMLEENPIIETFKTIKLEDKVLINEYEIEAINLMNISKSSVSYSGVSHLTNSRELSINEFIKSNELQLALKRAKTSLEDALNKGKEILDNFNTNCISINKAENSVLGYFQSATGKTVEVDYDFLANELSIFTPQNEVVVPLEDLIVLSKEEYEELCEGDATKNIMMRSLEETRKFSIQKLENGYVVNEKYYETLEEFFEE